MHMDNSIIFFSNSVNTQVRTQALLRIFRRASYPVELIAWKRGPADNTNPLDLAHAKLTEIPAGSILSFLIKACIYSLSRRGAVYFTNDVRMIPLIIFLAHLKKGVSIYDSKELPIVTAYVRLAEHRLISKSQILIKLFYRLYKYYEYLCLKGVDGVLCIDTRNDFYYKRVYKINKNVEVIYNVPWFEEKITEKYFEKYYSIYGHENVVIFSGRLYLDKGMKQYLQAIKELKQDIPKLRLIICGRLRMPKEELENIIKEYNITDNVTIMDNMPYDEHVGLLKCCKVGLALMNPNRPKHFFIGPGTARKIFTYMGAGLPVIISKGHFSRIVEEEQAGITVRYDNIQDLVGALRRLLTDETYRRQLAGNALRVFELKYNLAQEEKKVLGVLARARQAEKI